MVYESSGVKLKSQKVKKKFNGIKPLSSLSFSLLKLCSISLFGCNSRSPNKWTGIVWPHQVLRLVGKNRNKQVTIPGLKPGYLRLSHCREELETVESFQSFPSHFRQLQRLIWLNQGSKSIISSLSCMWYS